MASTNTREREYIEMFNELESDREAWEGLWEDVTRYVLPERDLWESYDTHPEADVKKGEEIFDSKAVSALQTLANGLIGYNVGPTITWFKLRLLHDELNDIPGVKDWLEQCEKVIYSVFHRSNFYDSVNEYYQDLGSIGTATMIVEENIGAFNINYDARHPKETYLVESASDRIDSVYRQFWLSGRNALRRYGTETMPETLVKDMENEPTNRWRFIHIVHPREDRVIYSDLPQDKPILSVEMYYDDETILFESGYDDMPILTSRWRKNSNEIYGRSPSMSALSAIKRVNQHKLHMMQAGQLAVQPILQGPKEMLRRLKREPFAFNQYKDPQRRLFTLDTSNGYPFGRDILDQIYEEIDDHFLTDLFLMLQRSERQMTAREIVERQGEKVAGLAGPLTRQNHEFLGPVVKRTFNISMQAGWLPPPPEVLLKTGIPLDVDFTGLLAQAQKRYHQANSINAGLSVIGGIIKEFDPSARHKIDFHDLVEKIAEAEGFPQSSLREDQEVEELVAQEKEQQQQAQQSAMMEQQGKANSGLAKAPEVGSPAESIMNQITQSAQTVNKGG